QSHIFWSLRGSLEYALRTDAVCQASSGVAERTPDGMEALDCTPMMNKRGRDCGTKRIASSTSAPALYPACAMASISAVKSPPPCELNAPTTFSRTTICGTRRCRIISQTSFQKGVKVPLRSPFKPAPDPPSDKSWQGNEAQTSVGTPGKSSARRLATSSTLSSLPPK